MSDSEKIASAVELCNRALSRPLPPGHTIFDYAELRSLRAVRLLLLK